MRRNVVTAPESQDREAWSALLRAAEQSGLTLNDLVGAAPARPARTSSERGHPARTRLSADPPAQRRPEAEPSRHMGPDAGVADALLRIRAQLDALERHAPPRAAAAPLDRWEPDERLEQPRRAPAPPSYRREWRPQPADRTVQGLRSDIEALRDGMAGLATRAEVAAVERAIRGLSGAVAQAGGDGDARAVAGILTDLQRQVGRLSTEIPEGVQERVGAALDRLDGKLDAAAAAGTDPHAIRHLADQLDDLRHALGELAEPRRIERLSDAVADLGRQFVGLRASVEQARTAGPDLLSDEIRALRQRIDCMAENLYSEALPKALSALNARVEEVQARQAKLDPEAFAALRGSLEDAVRDLRAEPEPGDEAVLEGIGDLRKLLRQLTNRIEPGALGAVREQLQQIAGRLDGGSLPEPGALDPLFERLAERLEQTVASRVGDPGAMAGSPLEAVLQSIESRFDETYAPGGPIDRIEHRVDAIAGLLADEARTEPLIEAVQAALGDALAELREAREDDAAAAVEAARLAVRDALGDDPSRSSDVGEILWRLDELRTLQSDIEGTTLDTLEAVRTALETFAEKPRGQTAPADPTWSGRLDAAMRRLRGERAGERELPDPAPQPVHPAHGVNLSAEADPSKIRSAFIAAARRAARDEDEDHGKDALGSRLKKGFLAHRRAVAAGAAVSVIALGLVGLAGSFGLLGLPISFTTKMPGTAPAAVKAGAPAPFVIAKAPAAPPSLQPEDAPRPDVRMVPTTPTATPASPVAVRPAEDLPATLPAAVRQGVIAGTPSALYEAALHAVDGRDMQRDSALGARLLEKASAAGYAPAQVYLGHLYERGVGVPRDLALAHDWYRRAAERGNARAMHNLAVLLTAGVNGRPNYPAALPWFQQAAELGLRDSQYNLAVILAWGVGTPRNLPEAYKWFTVVANQGDKEAAARRDEVAGQMSPADLAAARALAEAWRPKNLDQAANAVQPATQGSSATPAPPPAAGRG